MDYPIAWMEVFDRSIEANRRDPLAVRIRVASHAVAAFIESDPVRRWRPSTR